MSLTHEEMESIAFDPPHLGMPAGPCRCGRWERADEGFVEIFVRVEEERITDVGFLTSIDGDGLVCASLCCQALQGKSLNEARTIGEHDILDHIPPAARTESLREITTRCVDAARRALPR